MRNPLSIASARVDVCTRGQKLRPWPAFRQADLRSPELPGAFCRWRIIVEFERPRARRLYHATRESCRMLSSRPSMPRRLASRACLPRAPAAWCIMLHHTHDSIGHVRWTCSQCTCAQRSTCGIPFRGIPRLTAEPRILLNSGLANMRGLKPRGPRRVPSARRNT